ncbi:MAG: sulfatase [Bacteroidetes bacterium MedPE-SWsnd-G2]|nr:MAG: sulfatase [Bacteroidetes bacterium MedPE-SWsnd-G2]
MKLMSWIKKSGDYLKMVLALIFTFWLLTAYECYAVNWVDNSFTHLISTFITKCINDFWAAIVIGILVFPFYRGLELISQKAAAWVVHILFTLIVLGEYALVKYSLTTLVNLGADILGYSFNDMFSTVAVSESISILYFLPFVICPLVYFSLFLLLKHKLKSWPNPSILIIVFCCLLVGKLVIENVADSASENKLVYFFSDIVKYKLDSQSISDSQNLNRLDYPLLRDSKSITDVLTPYLKPGEKKPNIVVIVVEGLGSEYVAGNNYSGFMPYLDSLIDKSLYWENFVSTTGRSFGILPSLFGSLPYGEKGFLELVDVPSHLTLMSVLKLNNYKTNYISGGPSQFDRKVNFLEFNQVDNIIDENLYDDSFTKTESNDGGFTWGYPDSEIFRMALSQMDDYSKPRLDVIMTLSNHEPFQYPDKDNYIKEVEKSIENSQKPENVRAQLRHHTDILGCLKFTDNSLRVFMNTYQATKDFDNTIFVITGDHRLIPMAQKDKLCRFHVPFLIYSPNLNSAQKFKGLASHWDVTPSLLKYLSVNYSFNPIDKVAWMGAGLDVSKTFRNRNAIPLMRYKGSLNDMIYKDYFYSDGDLFQIKDNFETYKVSNSEVKKQIEDTLFAFKSMNAYVTQNKKIFPDSLNIYITPKKKFTEQQLNQIAVYSEGKTYDDLLLVARDLSHNKEFDKAILLCDYILNEYPNYTDAIVLKGRSYAWQGEYALAEPCFNEAQKRSPFYDDSYMAILDMYWWSGQENKSESIYKKAVMNKVGNPDVAFKMAKAYGRINRPEDAVKVIDSLLYLYPNNSEYKTLKKSIK